MKYLKPYLHWIVHNFSEIKINFKLATIVWLITATLTCSWILFQDKPREEFTMYSDVATHLMIASSIWHDFDLLYSAEDLERFKENFPGDSGPRGLYLKQTSANELVFAKPYLYGASASIFYGIFNFKGFIVFNSICLFVIGLVVSRSLRGLAGENWGLLLGLGFVLPSPFVAWVAVPHPDLFIAALLSLSGYLLLRKWPITRWQIIVGALLFAFVIHDKPVFVLLLPFLMLAMPNGVEVREYIFVVLTIFMTWLVLSLPNFFVDGTLLSYQGLRFYVGGQPFPLEPGWLPPHGSGVTAHVFNLNFLASSLIENLSLIPEKFFDFFFGRQTGIFVYFPVALFLLLMSTYARVGKGLWLFLGFFAYLVLYWLAFPTNGYGGAGSYGPRYMMQVLPIIPLAFIRSRYDSINKNITVPLKLAYIAVFFVAVSLQYKVFTFDDSVRFHGQLFKERPLNLFPVENWLLPNTAQAALPDSVERSSSTSEVLFNKTLLKDCVFLFNFCEKNNQSYVLFNKEQSQKISELELWGVGKQKVTLKHRDKVLWQGILGAGQPYRLKLPEFSYDSEAFDLLDKSFKGFAEFELLTHDSDESRHIDHPLMRFAQDHRKFEDYGKNIDASDLEKSKILMLRDWSHIEPWGIWSDGFSPQMVVRGSNTAGTYEVVFRMQAYTPSNDSVRKVRLMVNNRQLANIEFKHGDEVRDFEYRFKTLPGEEFINFTFEIENPVSPAKVSESSDSRMLGIGLVNFKLNKL